MKMSSEAVASFAAYVSWLDCNALISQSSEVGAISESNNMILWQLQVLSFYLFDKGLLVITVIIAIRILLLYNYLPFQRAEEFLGSFISIHSLISDSKPILGDQLRRLPLAILIWIELS